MEQGKPTAESNADRQRTWREKHRAAVTPVTVTAGQPIEIKSNVIAKYYIPKPKEDRKRSVGCKVTEQERRMLDELAVDCKIKGLPFKTASDILYWAFRRGMAILSEDIKSERFTNLFRQLNAEEQLLKLSEIRRRWQSSFTLLQQEVEVYDQEGMGRYVPRLLRDFEANLKATEPNPWVRKIGEKFYSQYGTRLKADRISNHPADSEKEE